MIARLQRTLAFVLAGTAMAAQAADTPSPETELASTIAALDAAAFEAFNHCEVPGQLDRYASFFDPHVEFYHDLGGVTWARDIMLAQTRANVCGKFQRELVPGTLKVWPIKGYGALARGEHRFCHYKPGGTTHPCEGLAEFMIVWHQQEKAWSITRVFSYGHGSN
ncbi:nuclear transport factor 2 family protein [Paucibacter sp. XJ19-41]|uniref:nuclear transport factor 2 family protein n=1 Tax=Paucibacter sp. XJ19-41 TaxID=2927824 RepID=UPI00234B148F|nr:nuclear transport factor 2 family protein [Paucibacter sp. XJ19-41]MDC6167055.1 nuclear transport factor 2 family protein [Paucibacter sp. XJ19-41]